jgi:hypothetical protein
VPKTPTFPTLYDDLKTISITFLAKHGYLKPNQINSGTITWSRHGNEIGNIWIRVNTQSEDPYMQLRYKCNEVPVNYMVQLRPAPSNLGKGVVWYFVCPYTGKRCRKLYGADTYFYHRSAFRYCMYEKQTRSHKYRNMDKQLNKIFGPEGAYEQIYSKHFKTHYNGKPTKRYLKLVKQIN